MAKLNTRTELTTLADGDLVHFVDISDTSADPTGTSKKVQATNVKSYINDFGTGAGQVTEGNDSRIPTQNENDALVGTNGTPSSTNRYVTELINIINNANSSIQLTASDANSILRTTNNSGVSLTIPDNVTEPLPEGTTFIIEQAGTGIVSYNAGVGVTINSDGGKLDSNGQYTTASLVKVALPDTWLLAGNLQ